MTCRYGKGGGGVPGSRGGVFVRRRTDRNARSVWGEGGDDDNRWVTTPRHGGGGGGAAAAGAGDVIDLLVRSGASLDMLGL